MTPSLSNHCPVYVCLNVRKQRVKCYTRGIWNLKHVNWEDLNSHLKQVDWSLSLTKPTISEMVKEWTNIDISELKKFIPFKPETKILRRLEARPNIKQILCLLLQSSFSLFRNVFISDVTEIKGTSKVDQRPGHWNLNFAFIPKIFGKILKS